MIFPWIVGLSLALSALSLSAWRFSEDQDLIIRLLQSGLREELSQQAQKDHAARLSRVSSDPEN